MIYTTTYHAHRKQLGIKQDEYTMLHAVMLLQNLEKNGFWCVAPNEYFTTFMDAETIRGVQKISKRLADMGLLIKGKGTRKRVSDEFVIGFNKFSKTQIGTHEQSSPTNSVHPKHEQRSPLNTNSVHVYHEQSSPNIERIESNSKRESKEEKTPPPFVEENRKALKAHIGNVRKFTGVAELKAEIGRQEYSDYLEQFVGWQRLKDKAGYLSNFAERNCIKEYGSKKDSWGDDLKRHLYNSIQHYKAKQQSYKGNPITTAKAPAMRKPIVQNNSLLDNIIK